MDKYFLFAWEVADSPGGLNALHDSYNSIGDAKSIVATMLRQRRFTRGEFQIARFTEDDYEVLFERSYVRNPFNGQVERDTGWEDLREEADSDS